MPNKFLTPELSLSSVCVVLDVADDESEPELEVVSEVLCAVVEVDCRPLVKAPLVTLPVVSGSAEVVKGGE